MQAVSRIAGLVLTGLALAAGSAAAGGPGPLYGLVGGDGQAALTHVDPLNLQPISVRVPLGVFSRAWSFSADRTRLVVGPSYTPSLGRPAALRFVDLGRMRREGDLVLRGELGRIAGTAWVGRRVLAVVVVEGRTSHVLAVDPDARRAVGRVALEGAVQRGTATAGGLVLLLAPQGRIGRARLVVVDSALRARSVVLERITAGWEEKGEGEAYRVRAQVPALAVAAGRAYVLGAGGEPSAEVDLATLTVTYREERLLARAAKQIDQKARFAAWIGGGLLAVGRQDLDTVKRSAANGVSVLDVRDWSLRTLDAQASSFAGGGGLVFVFAERTGLRAFGPDGRERFSALADWRVGEVQVFGRRALVRRAGSDVPDVAVLDLDTGRVVRKGRERPPQLLFGRAEPIWG